MQVLACWMCESMLSSSLLTVGLLGMLVHATNVNYVPKGELRLQMTIWGMAYAALTDDHCNDAGNPPAVA